MAEGPKSAVDVIDPRIVRSRRMLMDGLSNLLSKMDFEDISVRDIVKEAELNRATFYLHYTDKNALLRAMTDVRFRALLERRGITVTDCEGALQAIALGVCDYLVETTSCPGNLTHLPLEGSIVAVIEDMVKEGLGHHALAPGFDASFMAATVAWGIYGAARRWFQTPNRIPAEEMASKIEAMVTPVLLNGQL
jgi:AcrR family transcriptional regulator